VLYAEMKEAIPAAMNGLDGIKDPWPKRLRPSVNSRSSRKYHLQRKQKLN
jgi:hypothetical protein